jgi:cell division ATPase FtsA
MWRAGRFFHCAHGGSKGGFAGRRSRVTERDINTLFEKAVEELGEIRGSIIHRSPAWFIVDEGKKTLEPMGMRGYELRGMISFVIADQFFLEDVQERFRSLGVAVNGCLSTPWARPCCSCPTRKGTAPPCWWISAT